MVPLIATELADSQLKLSLQYVQKLEEWRIIKEFQISLKFLFSKASRKSLKRRKEESEKIIISIFEIICNIAGE